MELLVVIGVLSLLAITLFPALAANRSGSQAFQCLSNHRQLVAGWMTYAAENSDRLPTTKPVEGVMSWGANPDSIDAELLVDPQRSVLARYVTIPEVWKCPADTVPADIGPRVRSVSFNGPLNGVSCILPPPGLSYPPGRQYLSRAVYSHQLRKPSEVFLSMDEHPDGINDSLILFNPGKLPPLYSWRDLPASYHNGAAGYSAADGRAEMHRWLEESTMRPITKQPKPWSGSFSAPDSVDYKWMNDMMPYKQL